MIRKVQWQTKRYSVPSLKKKTFSVRPKMISVISPITCELAWAFTHHLLQLLLGKPVMGLFNLGRVHIYR